MIAFPLLACTHGPAKPVASESPSKEVGLTTPAATTPTVILQAQGRSVRVEVEVARTTEDRARGLMYRRELAPYRGMLFVFEIEEVQSFWMQNTYIPLDMIFIDAKKRVVGVVENAEPLTTVSRRVDVPSLFVLEVNSGFARRHGISPGASVSFEEIDQG